MSNAAPIRRYEARDLDEVLDAWYSASVIAHSFLGAEFLASERREVAEHWLPTAETFVYDLDGAVVGFISLIGDEVGAIFVHPEQQGRGIGRALMDHARRLRPFLELDVFEANETGRRFYDTYGFRPISRHTHDATGHTVLRLRLD